MFVIKLNMVSSFIQEYQYYTVSDSVFYGPKSVPWVWFNTMNPCLMSPSISQEYQIILWVQVCTISPNLYQVQVSVIRPSLYHEAKSLSLGQGYLKVWGWQTVLKGPRLAMGTLMSKIGKGTERFKVGNNTEHQQRPKMNQNSIISFFCPKGKTSLG